MRNILQAALGIAELCVMAMLKEGTSLEEARSKIWLFDSKGLVVKDRPEGGVTGHKVEYVKSVAPVKVLAEAIRKVKPTVLIGAAAIGGVFTKEIIQEISSYNDHPVIFALSNPTSKAECTAEQAYTYSSVSFSHIYNFHLNYINCTINLLGQSYIRQWFSIQPGHLQIKNLLPRPRKQFVYIPWSSTWSDLCWN